MQGHKKVLGFKAEPQGFGKTWPLFLHTLELDEFCNIWDFFAILLWPFKY